MNRYRCTFQGKFKGPFSDFSEIFMTVEAPSENEVPKELYKQFEHILGLKITKTEYTPYYPNLE